MIIDTPPLFNKIVGKNGNSFQPMLLEIGGWDMDTDFSKAVSHTIGSDIDKIVGSTVTILNDAGTVVYPSPVLDSGANGWLEVGINGINTGIITLTRKTAGRFDNTTFNDTGVNRGYVLLWFVI